MEGQGSYIFRGVERENRKEIRVVSRTVDYDSEVWDFLHHQEASREQDKRHFLNQHDITIDMRSVLLDWLIEVQIGKVFQ